MSQIKRESNSIWQLVLPRLNQPISAKLLACARKTLLPFDYHQRVLKAFQLSTDLIMPVAKLTAMAEGLSPQYHWLRADPVCLRVDLVHIYLWENTHLALQPEEITALLSLLNHYLAAENLELVAPNPFRWYLRCPKIPLIHAPDPQIVLGKAITDYLLAGKEREYWLKLFTELQMLLHHAPVNQQRRAHQLPTVDALWLWGAGEKSAMIASQTSFTQVFTNDLVTKGLALLNHIPVENNDAILTSLKAPVVGSYLICSELPLDAAVEQELFAGLLRLLKKENNISIRLFLGDGYCYDLSSNDLRRWWQILWKK